MRNTFMRMAAATVLLFGVAACTDTVVEPKSTVTAANIFDDPDSYRSFLAKIYAGLAVTGQNGPAGSGDIGGIDEGFSHYLRLLWQMNELPTDEAVIGWGDGSLQELNTMNWASNNQFLGAMYSRIYFQVTLVNEFLRQTADEKLEERGESEALRAEIQLFRAEARFLRALSYWHGIDLFGDIPLVDETFPLGATAPEQATRQEVYDFAVAELDDIMSALPAPGAAQYGRADQGAARMLLAKLYLNAGVYTGADAYGQAVNELELLVNSGAYQLDDEYQHMFLADNHTSPEFIFTVPQDGQNTTSWGGTTFLVHAAVGGNMNTADFGIDFGWWGLRTTPEFVDASFPEEGADGDSRALFFTDGQAKQIGNLTDFFQGYAIGKYKNITSTGTPGSDVTHPDTDYPMFRLGDALLMYAEAHLRGGGGSRTAALGYVNDLRERAFGTADNDLTDAEFNLDAILGERTREVYWEGHRRTDLIRFDQFASGIWAWKGGSEGGAPSEAFRNLYPLPATELFANPNLTQNPGY